MPGASSAFRRQTARKSIAIRAICVHLARAMSYNTFSHETTEGASQMDSNNGRPAGNTNRKRPSQISGQQAYGRSSQPQAARRAPSAQQGAQPTRPLTHSNPAPRPENHASAPRRTPANPPTNVRRQPVSRASSAPAYRPRKRRARRWPWVAAALVVIALWIPVIGWFTGFLPTPGAPVEETTETKSEITIDPAAGTAAIESMAEQGAEIISQLEQEDLSWRDAEFAVDPNKETDWNYEPNDRKVVYLTIDDGPSDKTQAVLDILDKYNCKATFFVTGINPDYAYQIKEEYKRGHTVGMHTYSHDYAQVYASTDAYFADLDAIGDLVKEQIGFVPCFIRFPGGSSNAISADYTPGIMSALVNQVQAAGYQYYDWNASSGDGSDHTADELYGYACEYDDLDNVVLLIHDSTTKQSTVDALPRIIEHYQGLGYTFEAIDRTTMVPHHGVNN